MCMYMYINMYICMYTCTCRYTCYMYSYMCVYMYTYMCVYMYTYMCMYRSRTTPTYTHINQVPASLTINSDFSRAHELFSFNDSDTSIQSFMLDCDTGESEGAGDGEWGY